MNNNAADGLMRTLSGQGSGIKRPNNLHIPIDEEKSDSKKTVGTGGEDLLDDLLKDDDDGKNNQLRIIPEGLVEESPCKIPPKE